MGLYRVCPNCGNSEENTAIFVCADCHLIFCDRCGNKEFDRFPLPFTTRHCPRCNSTELNSTGMICNNNKDISQIIRDEESVTVITDQGSCVTCDQRAYWSDAVNQSRFDEAVEEALRRDSQKRVLPKGISQIIRDEESVTVITDQGSSVTCEQRACWSDYDNQRRFDEAVEEALHRDSLKGKSSKDCSQTIIGGNSAISIETQSNGGYMNRTEGAFDATDRRVNSYSTSRISTSQLLDDAMSRLQQRTEELKKNSLKNTTGKCKACGSTWPLSILERGNGLCPMCQRMQEHQR